MSGAVEVVGADRLARTLRQAARDLRNLSDAHRRAGDEVARQSRQNARRRTGALASSFTVTTDDTGAQVSSGLVYAPIQEFGSRRRNISPSRALTRALESSTPGVADIYLAACEDAIGKVKGK